MLAEIFGMDGIVVIVVIAVVLFGGSQIPKLARSLGSARREFSQGLKDGEAPATEPARRG
jgi:sec-independent protein translocase protein TatA